MTLLALAIAAAPFPAQQAAAALPQADTLMYRLGAEDARRSIVAYASPSGRRWVLHLVGERDTKVVLDGELVCTAEHAGPPVYSHDERHVAWVAGTYDDYDAEEKEWTRHDDELWVDGKRRSKADEIDYHLGFEGEEPVHFVGEPLRGRDHRDAWVHQWRLKVGKRHRGPRCYGVSTCVLLPLAGGELFLRVFGNRSTEAGEWDPVEHLEAFGREIDVPQLAGDWQSQVLERYAVAPDGSRAAVTVRFDDGTGIVTLRPDGRGRVLQDSHLEPGMQLGVPAFSTRGRMAFARRPASGGRVEVVVDGVALDGAWADVGPPAFSPDGGRVAYAVDAAPPAPPSTERSAPLVPSLRLSLGYERGFAKNEGREMDPSPHELFLWQQTGRFAEAPAPGIEGAEQQLDRRSFVVVDGEPLSETWPLAIDPRWSPSGGALAYRGADARGWFLVLGSGRAGPFEALSHPAFLDELRVGFYTVEGRELWWRVLAARSEGGPEGK